MPLQEHSLLKMQGLKAEQELKHRLRDLQRAYLSSRAHGRKSINVAYVPGVIQCSSVIEVGTKLDAK